MAGIPVYTSSPISPNVATKASAISPSTLTAADTPAFATATATATSSSAQPRTAQPGAPAGPQPTNAAGASSNDPPRPTPTQPLPGSSDPPAPQPGAVPHPGNIPSQSKQSSPTNPRAATTQPVAPYSPVPLPAHQSSGYLSTPTRAVPPASVTSTYSGPQDLSHPPGYVQNSRASFEDRSYLTQSNDSSPFSLPGNVNRRSTGVGILNGEMYNQENRDGQEDKGVWGAAMTWAKTAGKKLSQAEEDVWKRVNGEK